jgi:integrase
LAAILARAVADGFIPTNPATGVKLGGRAVVKRRGFRADELQRLFALPVFTEGATCAPHGAGPRAGGHALYWLPLIALYSGARLHELAQLRVSDFREHPAHGPYFEIHERAEGSSVKTAASSREVPVHPMLVELGLLRYVRSLPAAGMVFPELPVGDDGAVRTDPMSKALNRLLGRAGLTDPSLVFHSFRHTFATVGRECGIRGGTLRALMGHDSADVHDDYGEVTLRDRAAAIASYRVDGLDLSSVRLWVA